VFYYTKEGQVAYFPAAWTDAGQVDPFVVLSAQGERRLDSKTCYA
jgi:hypothetical protein